MLSKSIKFILRKAIAITCGGFFIVAIAAAPLEDRSDNSWSQTQDSYVSREQPDSEVYTQSYVSAENKAEGDNAVNTSSFVGRLSQIEDEVRDLRGQLEQQSHKIQQLISLQAKLFQDIDQRLDALGKNSTHNVEAKRYSSTINEEQAAVENGSPEAEQKVYQAAYTLLHNKQYVQAKRAMQNFLKRYPQGEYSVNAHYWLGELSLLTGDDRLAKTEFETVIKKYPTSSKVSDAMLKLGLLHLERGDKKLAQQQLQKIVNTFPNSAAANIAKKRLQSL